MQTVLQGLRVVEFEGIGPGPLAGRMLAQMGAELTLIARPHANPMTLKLAGSAANPLHIGKRLCPIDLKAPGGVAEALALIDKADALIEGNRPGVMERLGLGPELCLARNPKLVYGRMTGWGQHGPLAHAAGHDLNYVARSGLLSLAQRAGPAPLVSPLGSPLLPSPVPPPVPPILPPTVVGDATGALGLAFGIVCGVLAARSTGRGSVVDAAITDITAMLGGLAQWLHASGSLGGPEPSAFHDSPFYDTYACADGGCITVGALEPQFYALLLQKLGLADVDPTRQYDKADWPALKARFTKLFETRTRAEWCDLLEGTDACFAPVLTIAEAAAHPHNVARGVFEASSASGICAVGAPRFSWPESAADFHPSAAAE